MTNSGCPGVDVPKKLSDEQIARRRKCGYSEFEVQELYGWVDVVAWKDGKIWAFEVKNVGDKVKVALLQTANYAKYFDYSCVLAYDFKELMKYRQQFKDLGVGTYYNEKGTLTLLDEPKLQVPSEEWHNRLYLRFLKTTGMVNKQNPFNKSLHGLFPDMSQAEIEKN